MDQAGCYLHIEAGIAELPPELCFRLRRTVSLLQPPPCFCSFLCQFLPSGNLLHGILDHAEHLLRAALGGRQALRSPAGGVSQPRPTIALTRMSFYESEA